MGSLLTAEVKIKGVRPLLWHAFGPEAIPLTPGERTGVAGNDPEEWRKTVLMTPERQLYLLPSYIFSCLRDGAKYTKQGRGSIQSAVAATMQVADDVVLVDRFVPPEPIPTDRMQPVYIDISSVRNPATKGRNVRYRVASGSGWSLAFHLLWDKTIVSRHQLEAVTTDAGKLSGLGDGRSIGFGRFEVTSFDVSEG